MLPVFDVMSHGEWNVSVFEIGNILLSVMRTVRLGLDRRLRLHAMTKGATRVRRDGIRFIVAHRR
jgi:hypothetical protein